MKSCLIALGINTLGSSAALAYQFDWTVVLFCGLLFGYNLIEWLRLATKEAEAV